MNIIYIVTALAVLLSLIVSREKTKKALIIGAKKLWKITGPFVSVIIGVSIVLYLVPNEVLSEILGGEHNVFSTLIASILGSVTVMPGPIVYPLCKILVDQGVAYNVVAVFSTTLMMVGLITFPMEKAYFGTKFAVLRNLVGYFISITISIAFIFIQGWFL
ncbi:MAG: hypothetical protein B6229_10905 [Spirochaetaceae bacterium 4572_7]|nr:MAG: hypothetical protein B6229_10905 [Spirochaetaceae bacterium 4572_7]